MPSVKDFDKNKKLTDESNDNVLDLDVKKSKGPRRRPGRDADETIAKAERLVAEAEVLAADDIEMETTSEDTYEENMNENHEGPEGFEATDKKESPFKRLRVNIKGHDVLNIETPEKVLEFADAVAEEWKTDGSFNGLPTVGHPLAQIAVAKGLRTAKDIEKKLEEKGVFALAQMGIGIIKSKLKK